MHACEDSGAYALGLRREDSRVGVTSASASRETYLYPLGLEGAARAFPCVQSARRRVSNHSEVPVSECSKCQTQTQWAFSMMIIHHPKNTKKTPCFS